MCSSWDYGKIMGQNGYIKYPLVISYIAIENGDFSSGFSH